MRKVYKTLSYEQITSTMHQTISFDEGLNSLSREGWELVTSFPSKGYAPGCTTMFVFKRAS
jgi:hypothetical protein